MLIRTMTRVARHRLSTVAGVPLRLPRVVFRHEARHAVGRHRVSARPGAHSAGGDLLAQRSQAPGSCVRWHHRAQRSAQGRAVARRDVARTGWERDARGSAPLRMEAVAGAGATRRMNREFSCFSACERHTATISRKPQQSFCFRRWSHCSRHCSSVDVDARHPTTVRLESA